VRRPIYAITEFPGVSFTEELYELTGTQQFQIRRLPINPAIHFLRYCPQESANRHENGSVSHTVKGDSKNGKSYLESLTSVPPSWYFGRRRLRIYHLRNCCNGTEVLLI
jgi:hypothetical protein